MSRTACPQLHRFGRDTGTLPEPPRQFTFPFRYVPHPMSVEAAREVQAYVATRADWADELAQGKMLGTLVVRDTEGQLGFLAAFSGNLAGSNRHSYFVPPVYDLLQPQGEFKTGEAEITAINHEIDSLEHSPQLASLRNQLAAAREQGARNIEAYRATMAQARERREALRQAGNLSPAQQQALIAESQFQKAELKRMKRRVEAQAADIEAQIAAITSEAGALRVKRKLMSERLQQHIFSLFVVQNARGERRDLGRVFSDAGLGAPPSGAGECCAPKLQQHAYRHHLQPVCMAEFWWGRSPAGMARRHGDFCPACQSKCKPILDFMLQGLDVEPNPLEQQPDEISIIYEDQWIVAVNKPAGMLSVPGKLHATSLQARLRLLLPEAAGPMVAHRLDLDTSGIVLAAKDLGTFAALQRQFATRAVSKRYVAIVQGWPASDEGIISVPLRPDPDNRPLQVADPVHGKEAVTRYHVMERRGDSTARVEFFPRTGRTHQLRLHAALPQGLGCPIVGDMLYGHRATGRLMLHAQSITFTHPVTGRRLTLTAPEPF